MAMAHPHRLKTQTFKNGARQKTLDELLFNLAALPTPDLDPAEELLPQKEKELRIVVKKCVAMGAFGLLDLDTVLPLIQPDLDDVEGEGEVLFQNGDGPELFYLMWFKNSDKGYLLNRWLTDSVATFDRFPTLESAIGCMIAAFYVADGYWYRGIVLDCFDERHVRIIYIDYGNTDIVPLHYMRVLPDELTRIPPLSFAAKLVDINPFKEDPKKLDKQIKRNFIYMVNQGGALKARLKDYNDERHLWEVFLWRGPEPFVEVNQMVRELIFKKHDTPVMKPCEMSKSDLNKLIHLTHEVSIREYREVSLKGLRNYRVTNVISPMNFSVEYTPDESPNQFIPERPWQDFMQKFYNDPKNAHKYRLRTSRVFVNRCYVWKNPETQIWRRIRVLKSFLEVRRCEVYAVDIGYFRIISFDDIYEICVQFSTYTALCCNAFLVDICPPGIASDWPQESIIGFKKLVKGKVFQGVVSTRETVDHGFADSTTTRLGVILVEKGNHTSVTINAQLCALGLADSDGLASSRAELLSSITSPAHFDSDQYQEFLIDNGQDPDSAIDIDLTVPSVLAGVFPKESTNNEGVTWTRRPGFYGAWFSGGIGHISEELEHVPTIIRRRLGICNILRVASPGCFYISLAESAAELTQMMANLRLQVQDKEPLEMNEIVDGAFVAVNMIDDHDVSNWHRAIIKQTLAKIKMIKVILIDFGAEARTRREHVRALPEFFKAIPGFCHRVHLDVKGLSPHDSVKWSQIARDVFRRYLMTWEQQLPVYYVWQPKKASKLELEEFDQEVQLNPDTERWELGDKHYVPHEKHIAKIKDHVMLKNIFCSLGVDIAYEIFTHPNEDYRFGNIWDLLKEKGYADYYEQRPDQCFEIKVFSDCEFGAEPDDGDATTAAAAARWGKHPEVC